MPESKNKPINQMHDMDIDLEDRQAGLPEQAYETSSYAGSATGNQLPKTRIKKQLKKKVAVAKPISTTGFGEPKKVSGPTSKYNNPIVKTVQKKK